MKQADEKKIYTKSLFIFRRDLRLHDNTALIAALSLSHTVILCFIFDPRQIDAANKYRSNNALQFMVESLQDLEQQCTQVKAKLFYFYGQAHEIVQKIIVSQHVEALFCNNDYTPFSIMRDTLITGVCNQNGIAFHSYDDALLINPKEILTKKGTPFAKFTAFYNAASKLSVESPIRLPVGDFHNQIITDSHTLSSLQKTVVPKLNKQIYVHGGTLQAEKQLKQIGLQKKYVQTHDMPAQSTSNLSAYLKFGCISIRHVYHSIKTQLDQAHPLIRQLYWRDFFTYIAFHSPHIFGHSFQPKYDQLPWSYNAKHFNAWCSGTTGFPIVDAGMRQLNTTGYMHNRVRMIVASFLTKDLHINWLDGERYFAQQLVDYDPAINNGNWQWCASTGCDAQPYFRIFNPWLQQKKFDPECIYIKKWVSELETLDPKIIHSWYTTQSPHLPKYPKPIVDHTQESALTKKLFRAV